jgi:hypothetical protein
MQHGSMYKTRLSDYRRRRRQESIEGNQVIISLFLKQRIFRQLSFDAGGPSVVGV